MPKHIKPLFVIFIFYPLLATLISLSFLGIIAVRFFDFSLSLTVLIISTLFFYNALQRYVMYTKEHYTITTKSIIHSYGDLFSSNTTTIEFKRVNLLRKSLPFVSSHLFDTGHIIIESSGSDQEEIVFSFIDNIDDIFSDLQTTIFPKKNNVPILEAKPAPFGAFIDALTPVFSALVVIYFILLDPSTMLLLEQYQLDSLSFTYSFIALILILLLLYIGTLYADYTLRTYSVYESSISYNEGFLAREYVTFDRKRISDIHIQQLFIKRLFGISDVRITTFGKNNSIYFTNLRKAQKIYTELFNDSQKDTTEAITPHHTYTINGYSFLTLPTLFILISFFFPVLFIFSLPLFLQQIVAKIATTYSIHANSVQMQYKFFTTQFKEYQYDKITTLHIKQHIFQRLFNTYTIEFWSLGSSDIITMKHIKLSQAIKKKLIASIAPLSTKPTKRYTSNFNFSSWLSSSIYTSIILMIFLLVVVISTPYLLAPSILVIILLLLAMYLYNTYKFQYTYLKQHASSLHIHLGLIQVSDYYMQREHIKKISALHYPLTSQGSLIFHVAGEMETLSDDTTTYLANSVTFPFIVAPFNQQACFFPQLPIEPPKTYSRDYTNSIVKLLITSCIIFPLLIFLPLTIPFMFFYIKSFRYTLYDDRIIAKSGIIYRRHLVLLKEHINHKRLYQGLINKAFNNFTMYLYTIGRSSYALALEDIQLKEKSSLTKQLHSAQTKK